VRETFLFVRPPRAMWPFNGPSTAFWPPLAFASLAAALRDNVPDLDVRIIDCPAEKIGWKTLTRELEKSRPSYVGIGEEAVSAAEGLRLAEIAHGLGAAVIAGGCTFGNLASEVLASGLVDVVARGEGERTIVEVVEALRQPSPAECLARVDGITFRRDDKTVTTPDRELIDNLDDLPMPAYDLLPVAQYGKGSLNHPNLASIEHSRGCVGDCAYCVLWRQMADGGRARCRTKSVERAIEEVRVLTRQYGRRYLAWVDPCFNADGRWCGEFAERMLREDLAVGQSAWVRPDRLLADENEGRLGRMVESGLNEIFVGVERADDESIGELGRRGNGAARKIMPLIARKYPSLYTVGSFIYGLPGDSWRTVKAMRDETFALVLDMAFYIPLTGLPGTAFWRDESWSGGGRGLSGMDFLTSPDARVSRLTRMLALSFLVDWRPSRVAYTWRTLLTADKRKRRMSRRLFARGASYAVRMLSGGGRSGAMIHPAWYDA
jgi:radical SAM superfamily enzyme YgiQ (UPF0313 family)